GNGIRLGACRYTNQAMNPTWSSQLRNTGFQPVPMAPVNKPVLYLAYFFPPRGGAAVQRSLKFAKYLPQFSWRPLVVANGGAIQDNTLKVQDPTMLKELPAEAVVRYTALNARENRRYLRAQSKFRQRLNVTDP